VILAFADSAGFLQHGDRPAMVRSDRTLSVALEHVNASRLDESFKADLVPVD
jgi:hypothetical protein